MSEKSEPISFIVNGVTVETGEDGETPLLWFIRDHIGLTGTKFGCGIGMCGACTVHAEGRALRSCITPIESLQGGHVTTIEGLSVDDSHPVQLAWQEMQVPQCGYCQSGQIMQAVALLSDFPDPSDDIIDSVMEGNLCRCMTYPRIRAAVKRAAAIAREVESHG